MSLAFRLFRRKEVYYVEETRTGRQSSLRTNCPAQAQCLHAAKNEAVRNPLLNLALAKTYLAAQDTQLVERKWSTVMQELSQVGRASTQERFVRAAASKAFNPIRNKKLVETTADDLLAILKNGRATTNLYLRRLHNFALGVGWIVSPVLHPKLWPKVRHKSKRAVSQDEHSKIIAAEKNLERRLYYQILWETGAAQTDAAKLSNENIDWKARSIVYHRQKLQPDSPPARIAIGPGLERILKQLPKSGSLFPKILKMNASSRASEFRRRCNTVKISGVSLHSYRYSWAERALVLGYPERWAKLALGHGSTAVHIAYSKGANLICPALDNFVIPMSKDTIQS